MNITEKRQRNCPQTPGERLKLVVPSLGLGRIAAGGALGRVCSGDPTNEKLLLRYVFSEDSILLSNSIVDSRALTELPSDLIPQDFSTFAF